MNSFDKHEDLHFGQGFMMYIHVLKSYTQLNTRKIYIEYSCPMVHLIIKKMHHIKYLQTET